MFSNECLLLNGYALSRERFSMVYGGRDMLYAVPQHSTNSLELVKMVLQMVAMRVDVSESLISMVYDVIREAKELSINQETPLQLPNHRESISLAIEMKQIEHLASLMDIIKSKDMLQPEIAKNVLEHI